MSNIQHLAVSSELVKELKVKYLELITNGYTENVALQTLNFPRPLYLKLLLEDLDFIDQVEKARKLRADFWVSKIAESVDEYIDPDLVPSERLKFDKLVFLARTDNPERYGNNAKKLDVSIDLGQFKLLPPDEAIKSLASDPFALEVEFTEIPDKDVL